MDVGVEEIAGHRVVGFAQNTHRVEGTIGAADVQEYVHDLSINKSSLIRM
jgi:hypothetical protein